MTGEERERLKLKNQLCFPLYAAARRVTAYYTPYLKPLGLTYTQYLVFLVLWEEDGVTVGELCRRLRLDNGTVTPLLKKLEARGLIRRVRSAEDERVVTVYLEDKGREMQEQAREIPAGVGCCLNMPKEDMEELYRLLYKVIGDGCDAPEEE